MGWGGVGPLRRGSSLHVLMLQGRLSAVCALARQPPAKDPSRRHVDKDVLFFYYFAGVRLRAECLCNQIPPLFIQPNVAHTRLSETSQCPSPAKQCTGIESRKNK